MPETKFIETAHAEGCPRGLAGDILLLSPRPYAKNTSVYIQRILRPLTSPSHSHVAISLGKFAAMHSTPNCGVEVIPLKTLIDEYGELRVKILRNQHLAMSRDLRDAISEQLWYYIEQPYFSPLRRSGDRSSYCSELAAKAFNAIGHPLSHHAPRHTLPIDLEKLETSSDWRNVTFDYLLPNIEVDFTETLGRDYQTNAKMDDAMLSLERSMVEMRVIERKVAHSWDTRRKKDRRFRTATTAFDSTTKYWDGAK